MLKINLKSRSIIGKKVKNLRKDGKIPANVYGPNRESVNVYLEENEFIKLFEEARYNTLIEAEVEGEKKKSKVLIKEINADAVRGDVLHVSFYEVDDKKKIYAKIPVEVVGVSPAVKSNIGLLVNPITQIRVRCLPGNLVRSFVIDISGLENIGDGVRIKDIKFPEGIDLDPNTSENLTVAYISKPQKKIEVDLGEDDDVEESENGEEGEVTSEEGESKQGSEG